MFNRKNTVLVIIDLQAQLVPHMAGSKTLVKNAQIMVKAAHILKIPILVTEQNPTGIGKTIPEINALLDKATIISKHTFSCYRSSPFRTALRSLKRHQLVLIGIESHVCIYQTAFDLVQNDYEVQAIADAISSRTEINKEIGLERMKAAGASIGSVESCVFELLETSVSPEFKQILKLIK